MVAISIENVWKYYGETVAVQDLNLECKDGEFVCVLGPSGCGKSSTMRMLAGLEHISAGQILFGDKRINDLAPKDRDIAMVFENYALYPHKTVAENMANPLRMAGVDKPTVTKKVLEAAKLLEIDHLLDRKPGELSGGQKQRVAIGRVIVRQPAVYLFDEPIAHLDAKLRARMRTELKHLQQHQGVTTVYVTHDQLEALSMADRIAVMHDGVLQQFGTPAEIYSNPVNTWVAGFVGEPTMNLILTEVATEADKPKLTHKGFTIDLDGHLGEAALRGNEKALRFGIRPENLKVSLEKSPGAIEGTVYTRQLLGSDLLVEVETGNDHFRVRTSPAFEGEVDRPCYISYDLGHAHLFSAETGQSIV